MTNNRWLKPLKNHQEKRTAAANQFQATGVIKTKVTENIKAYYFKN